VRRERVSCCCVDASGSVRGSDSAPKL
jgi:hypothetical protein